MAEQEISAQKPRNFSINFGPQHPAAHGVLRFSLSRETTEAELAHLLAILPPIVAVARANSLFAPAAE